MQDSIHWCTASLKRMTKITIIIRAWGMGLFSLHTRDFNNNHMSLDSQRILLYHDIHHANVENEIEI